jgi:hypothetical protein
MEGVVAGFVIVAITVVIGFTVAAAALTVLLLRQLSRTWPVLLVRRALRRRRPLRVRVAGKRRTVRVDAQRLGRRWAKAVRTACSARRQYDALVTATAPGPLRDRLAALGPELDGVVVEAWHSAQRAHTLERAGLREPAAAEGARLDLLVTRLHDTVTAAAQLTVLAAPAPLPDASTATEELAALRAALAELRQPALRA